MVVAMQPEKRAVLPYDPSYFAPNSKAAQGVCSHNGCSNSAVVALIRGGYNAAVCLPHAVSTYSGSVPAMARAVAMSRGDPA